MKKLSVCLIVKNEEPVLARCLSCAVRFADELIVVDTGSADRSVGIAKEYTPLVYLHPWRNSFAEARNYSYSKASGDYVMWLDADDVVTEENIARLRLLKEETEADVIFTMYGSQSETGLTDCILRDRIIRRSVFTEWRYDVHEGIPIDPAWKRRYQTGIWIHHKKEVVNEPERNMDIFHGLLSAGKTLEPFEKANLVKEYALHGKTEEAQLLFRELLPSDAGYEYAFTFLMRDLLRTEQWQACMALITETDRHLRPASLSFFAKGRCAEALGDEKLAEELYYRAMTVQEDPFRLNIRFTGYNDYFPLLRLAMLAEKRGERAEALRLLNRAGSAYPNAKEWQRMRLVFLLCPVNSK